MQSLFPKQLPDTSLRGTGADETTGGNDISSSLPCYKGGVLLQAYCRGYRASRAMSGTFTPLENLSAVNIDNYQIVLKATSDIVRELDL